MTQTAQTAFSPRFESRGEMLLAGVGGHYGNEGREQIPGLWGRFGRLLERFSGWAIDEAGMSRSADAVNQMMDETGPGAALPEAK